LKKEKRLQLWLKPFLFMSKLVRGVGDLSLARQTLAHDGGVKMLSQVVRDIVDLRAFIDFDCLAGRIQNNLTVAALAEMGLYLFEEIRRDLAVEVVC